MGETIRETAGIWCQKESFCPLVFDYLIFKWGGGDQTAWVSEPILTQAAAGDAEVFLSLGDSPLLSYRTCHPYDTQFCFFFFKAIVTLVRKQQYMWN